MIVDAEMEVDNHGYGLVFRGNFKPQPVWPNCQVLADKKLRISDHETRRLITISDWLRCAEPPDNIQIPQNEIMRGKVSCLLLFTSKGFRETCACTLILGQHPRQSGSYQRLGIAFTGSFSMLLWRKDYHQSELYRNWPEPEEWEHWEEFFADAVKRTVRII